MSITLTLSSNSSELHSHYFPPIQLEGDWSIGLLNFETFNSIPNVPKTMVRVGENRVEIAEGSYEIIDLENYINSNLPDGSRLYLKGNNNTMRCELKSNAVVDLGRTLATILGFRHQTFPPGKLYISESVVNIFSVNVIRLDVNIAKGSYLNNQPTHTVHEFFPSVPPGYKIIEVPQTIIYHSILQNSIDHLVVKILDQDNKPINFRGETVTVRLHLKKEK